MCNSNNTGNILVILLKTMLPINRANHNRQLARTDKIQTEHQKMYFSTKVTELFIDLTQLVLSEKTDFLAVSI